MQHITDDMIDAAVSPQDAQQVLLDAFRSFGHGQAAMQERIRTEAQGVKLSTLGAVIPEQKVAGAKVYTTIQGQFTFVIVLFSTEDGRALASFDAGAITRLRTAACSLIAARHLARPGARQMALFGAGVQGRAHAIQMAQAFDLEEIRVCDPYALPGMAADLQRQCGTPVRLCDAAETVAGADIVVTASRSTTPLFSGDELKPGCFVAAIGSSLPHTRELDDRALERAARIAVEWLPQTLREAGDLVLARPGLVSPEKLVELGALVTGVSPGRQSEDEITLYKSVGVGLEDVALAGLAWQRVQAGA
ncbi:MAG: ornithine cyclodeaminase family protein [Gammaproteobacteria bacterium]|jgi:ornithine cyclodeaminase|uniref:ornithine cyclodeaminase family protein n=1 Tax=Hydrogenophaga sp. TaxID=1904254 RepID=UPI0008D1A01C|nr:ornithine cyclodeaminase family protein [Hydrogenophaga sp.]MBU4181937.1 ornithine cyclodeaminase family protein [Gammaproteobacteria bacterium]OGB27399.1 MAG: ornithine cyclodeaminase [Burkholderiales bacterium RIFCSPLOWO2_02_FULL_66_35]MBU4280811.1 ornithine cyclodeaminase family protein [Gammaproteobacteria bacterium]MBU4323554.1 ornithine cyclodeaminase family protein [Gammaproteobacteria bacterium]MCG2653987.1 ornithine cyclodeaminase family protein [Hydrogenophaga sp.]